MEITDNSQFSSITAPARAFGLKKEKLPHFSVLGRQFGTYESGWGSI
jgi:hypothetical protein